MKKMITYEEFLRLVEEVNLLKGKTLSDIVDSDGNKRFIEDKFSGLTGITGLTILYNKWSLSGTHLMLVIAFKIDANTTIPAYTISPVMRNLPQFIFQKITPLVSGNFAYKTFKFTKDGAQDSSLSIHTYVGKNTNNVYISHVNQIETGADPEYCRIEYDILIP